MKISRSMFFIILLAMSFATIAGCVKLERPSLDRKYFTLDVKRGADHVNSEKSDKNLIVRRLKVSPRYEDRDLVYRTGENSFEADYYNAFFIAPASLLTQELRVWMGGAELFANVLGSESMGTGELLLEGVVNSIYGDYTGDNPVAVVEMQFFLLNNDNPDLPIVYSRNFSKKIAASSSGADDLVRAMNKGIKDIFKELESDIAAEISKSSQVKELSPVSQAK